ncbi:MAG: DUF4214 domain-containing protein [Acidimicrobiales bacterium]|nr:DUF4214 domain-containing protein [Acidimicrobiales bacterium]
MSLASRPLAGFVLALVLVTGIAAPAASQAQPDATEPLVQAADESEIYAPFATAAEFVEQQYLDILRRTPSQAEIDYQVGLLEDGRVPTDLIDEFVESAEANSNIKAVVRLYRAYYLRNPDFRGLSHWIQRRQQGITLNAISTEFARSPEFAVRYGVLSDEAFVDFVYERVMKREPDTAGRAYWLGRLTTDIHRGQFMTFFSESAEYVKLTSYQSSAVTLFTGMFQASMKEGPFSSLVSSLSSGRTTIAETAADYLDDRDYLRRFED